MKTNTRSVLSRIEPLEARIAPAAFRWNVDAGGSWTDENNWLNVSTGLAADGFPDASNDTAEFGSVITAARTITIPNLTVITVSFLTFNDNNDYTINGGLNSILELGGNGSAFILTGSAGNYTINSNIRLADDLQVNTNGSGVMAFDGPISETGGARSLLKTAGGILEYRTSALTTENNTYTGVTTVNDGTLRLNKRGVAIAGDLVVDTTVELLRDNQIADAAGVSISSGATLALGVASETLNDLTLAGTAQVAGTGTLTLGGNPTLSGAGALISANVNLGAVTRTFTVTNGAPAVDFEISGAISGTGGITTAGAGTMRLSGAAANTYTGLTTAGGTGFLELGKAAGVAASAGTFLITGAMRLVASDQIGDAQNITVGTAGDSGVLLLNNFNETFTGLTLESASSVSTGTGTLTLSGDVTVPAVASVTSISGNLALTAGTHTFNVGNGAAAVDLRIDAAVSGAASIVKAGAGAMDFDGTVSNTYTGTTTVNEGTLGLVRDAGFVAVPGELIVGDGTGAGASAIVTAQAGNSIPANAVVTIRSDGQLSFAGASPTYTIASLTMETGTSAGASLATAGTVTVASNIVVNSTGTGATGATISGTLNFGTAARTITVANGAAAADLTISGAITSGGGSGLVKAGLGTLRLSATSANTYTGNTTVNEGNLDLAGTDIEIPGGTLTIGDGTGAGNSAQVTLSGALNFNNNTALVVRTDGALVMGVRNQTVTTLTMESGTNEGAQISGSGGTLTTTGAVTFNATGTGAAEQQITANLTLGGNVTVNTVATSSAATISGTLNLGGLPRVFSIADSDGTEELDLQGQVTNGGINKIGAGTLRLSGGSANTFTGQTNVLDGGLLLAKSAGAAIPNAGQLIIGDGSGAAGSARVTFSGGAQGVGNNVTIKPEGLLDLAGFNLNLSGGGSPLILESGDTTGAQIVTGAGTFTPSDTVMLTVSGTGSIGASITGNMSLPAIFTFVVADGGAAVDLALDATISQTGAAGITKNGAGTLRLGGSGANTYTSVTTVNDGTLLLAKPAGIAPFAGGLVIGDGTGAAASAVVTYSAGNVLADTADLVIAPDGRLDIGAFDETIRSLTLQSGTTAGAQFATGSGRLTLALGDSSALTLATTGTGATAASFSGNLTLAAGAGLTVNHSATSAAPLIAGNITLADGAHTFLVNEGAAAAPDLLITSAITGSATAALTASGAGTLRLGGTSANTFGGGVDAQTGVLELGKTADTAAFGGPLNVQSTVRLLAAGQIPDASAVTLFGVGALDLNGFNEAIGALNITVSGAGAPTLNTGAATLTLGGDITATTLGTATPTIAGKLDLGGAARAVNIASFFTLDISAEISGAAGSALVLNGATSGANAAVLRLSGPAANTYAGTTTVTSGRIELSKTANIIALPGAIVVGDGTGVFSSGTGGAEVRALAAGQFANGTAVTIKSDAQLDLNGFDFTSGALAMESGDGGGARLLTGAGTLTLGGDIAFSVTGTGNIPATIEGNLSLGAANRTFTLADGAASADLIIAAAISGAAGVGLTKSGPGTLTLANGTPNTYSGATIIADGEIGLGGALGIPGNSLTIGDGTGASGSARVTGASANNLTDGIALTVKTDGLIALSNSFTAGALTLETGATSAAQVTAPGGAILTLGGNVTVVSTGTGATGAVISAALNLGAATRTFTIADGAAANDLSFTGNLTSVAGVDLVKAGAGALRLATGNFSSHFGATSIADGTLSLEATAQNSTFTVGDGTGAGGSAILRTVGDNRIGAAAFTVRTDGLFDLNGTTQIVGTLALESGTTAAAQITTGAGALTLSADVAVIVTGTGATGVAIAGTVDFFTGSHLFTIADGAAAVDLDFTATIVNGTNAALQKAGAGTLRMGGASVNELNRVDVLDGPFILNKSGGTPFTTELRIGDGAGTANSARFALGAGEQIPDAINIEIHTDGQLDLAGFNETHGGLLTMRGGIASGASLITGAGVLTLGTGFNFQNPFNGTGATGVSIAGTVNLGGAERQFNSGGGDAAVDVDISAALTGGAGSSLVIGGSGIVRLSGAAANTFAGTVTATNGATLELGKTGGVSAVPGDLIITNSGVVRLLAADQIADSGAFSTVNSGVLGLNGFNETLGPITLDGFSDILTGAGTLTLSADVNVSAGAFASITGNIALPTTRTFTPGAGATLTLNSTVSGAGGITVAGTGIVALSGSTSNTYAGATTVTGSQLALSKTGGAIAVPGALVIGDGIAVSAVQVASANQLAATTALTVNSGSTFAPTFPQALGSITLQKKDGVPTNLGGTLTLGGDFTVVHSGAVSDALSISANFVLPSGSHTFTIPDGGAVSDVRISGGTSGDGAFTKAGAGTLELDSSAVFANTGGVTIAAGTVDTAGSIAFSAANDITILAPGTLSLRGTNITIGDLTLETSDTAAAGLLLDFGATLTVAGSVTFSKIAASTATEFVFDLDAPNTISLNGVVSGPAGFGITKEGSGTLAMRGTSSNTYSGLTTVNEGTLTLGKAGGAQSVPDALIIGDDVAGTATVTFESDDQLAPGGAVTIRTDGVLSSDFAQSVGSLVLEKGDGQSAAIGGFGVITLAGDFTIVNVGTGTAGVSIGNGGFVLPAGNHTFTVPAGGVASFDVNFSSVISGAGGITKTGAGIMRLTGSSENTHTGTTTVADGTLELAKAGVAAFGGALIIGDGTGTPQSALVNALSGSQFPANTPVTIRSDGRFDANNYTLSDLTLEGGAVLGGFAIALDGTVSVTGGAVPASIITGDLRFSGSPVVTVSDGSAAVELEIANGVINATSSAATLNKAGAGTMRFAANTNIGTTNVTGGTLLVDANFNGGTIILSNGGRLGGNGTVLNSVAFGTGGGEIAPGSSAGTLTLTQPPAFAGGTLEIEVNGTGAGTDFDVFKVGGVNTTLDLTGSSLQLLPGFVPLPGQIFKVVDNLSFETTFGQPLPISGTFAGLPEGALVQTPAGNYAISYVGGDGNDVVLAPQFITPVIAANKKSATFKDADGDNVTVRVTKGTLDASQFLIIGAGSVGGGQLARLDLSDPADLFARTNLTITAVKPKLGTGDGFVNAGAIVANGVNLGVVIVKGDLSQIDAGTGDAKIPAIASLLPRTLGAKGITTQAGGGDLTSTIIGKLGLLKTVGDVKDATVSVTGNTGSILIGGKLDGGRIEATGNIPLFSAAKGINATSAANSGSIFSGGNLGKVTIGGVSGVSGGLIAAIGSGTGSASISATGNIGNITIKGDFSNGAGDAAGNITPGGKLGLVNILGFARGADIAATGTIAGVIVGKDLADDSSITSGARLGLVTVKGSAIGAEIHSADDIGAITVLKELTGSLITAEGRALPAPKTDVAIAKITVRGSVTDTSILAGYDLAGNATNADASIGPVLITKNWAASNLAAGMTNLGADQLPGGSGINADNVLFGDGNDFLIAASDDAKQTAKIASIIIKGTATGSTTPGDHFGIVAQRIGAIIIGKTNMKPTAAADSILLDTTNNDFRAVDLA